MSRKAFKKWWKMVSDKFRALKIYAEQPEEERENFEELKKSREEWGIIGNKGQKYEIDMKRSIKNDKR